MPEQPQHLEIPVKLFQEKQYADEFRKGNLYANPLSYFQKVEQKDGIADPFEGSVYSGKDGIFKIGPSQDELVDITRHLIGPVRFQGINYINVVCFHLWKTPYLQTYTDTEVPEETTIIKLPKRIQTEFGPHMVAIQDWPEFVKRVQKAFDKLYIANKISHWGSGKVIYKNNEPLWIQENEGLQAAFYKREQFAYQNEYRIAIEPTNITQKGGSPLRLDIGSIEDITMQLMSGDELFLKISGSPI